MKIILAFFFFAISTTLKSQVKNDTIKFQKLDLNALRQSKPTTFVQTQSKPSISGQAEINLKNGKKIEGTVKSLINGVLTVNFEGNNLTLKQSEIESIFFVKQLNQQTQTITNANIKGEIKGVITYFFNDNYGDKPDVGAKIYLRPADTTNGKTSLINKYERARTCRKLIAYNTEIESCTRLLKELNAYSKDEFDKLNKDVVSELFYLDHSNDVTKVTADGNGNYSASIKPGLYEVIYISKGRTDMTMAEEDGKIDTETISINAGDIKIIDKRFGL